eukprot:4086956-Amphidinium_carterae.1
MGPCEEHLLLCGRFSRIHEHRFAQFSVLEVAADLPSAREVKHGWLIGLQSTPLYGAPTESLEVAVESAATFIAQPTRCSRSWHCLQEKPPVAVLELKRTCLKHPKEGHVSNLRLAQPYIMEATKMPCQSQTTQVETWGLFCVHEDSTREARTFLIVHRSLPSCLAKQPL